MVSSERDDGSSFLCRGRGKSASWRVYCHWPKFLILMELHVTLTSSTLQFTRFLPLLFTSPLNFFINSQRKRRGNASPDQEYGEYLILFVRNQKLFSLQNIRSLICRGNGMNASPFPDFWARMMFWKFSKLHEWVQFENFQNITGDHKSRNAREISYDFFIWYLPIYAFVIDQWGMRYFVKCIINGWTVCLLLQTMLPQERILQLLGCSMDNFYTADGLYTSSCKV